MEVMIKIKLVLGRSFEELETNSGNTLGLCWFIEGEDNFFPFIDINLPKKCLSHEPSLMALAPTSLL